MLAIAYYPYISGIATSTRWAVISLTVPTVFLFLRSQRYTITWAHIFGTFFLAYALVSLAWTTGWYEGVDYAWKFALLGMVFCIGFDRADPRPFLKGLSVGLGLNTISLLFQASGHWPFNAATPNSGLFGNVNNAAEIMALMTVALVAYRLWWFLLPVVPGFLIVHSRASVLAFGAAAWVWLWYRSRIVVLSTIPLGVILVLLLAGLNIESAAQRTSVWADVVSNLTWQGHGLGSFYTDWPHFARRLDPLNFVFDHAHNDFLELTYELGIGVVFFLAFVVFVLAKARMEERAILCAFVALACFGFPLYTPTPAFVAAATAGFSCRVWSAFHRAEFKS